MQLLKIGQRKKNRPAPGCEADKSKSPDIQLTGRAVNKLLRVPERYDHHCRLKHIAVLFWMDKNFAKAYGYGVLN
jgi:hypothetical protein